MKSDDEIQAHAAKVMKEWRLSRGMSQKELAEKVGLHQTAIGKIESLDRRVDFATMVRIADILDIPWSALKGEKLSDEEKFSQSVSAYNTSLETMANMLHETKAQLERHKKTLNGLMNWVGRPEMDELVVDVEKIERFLDERIVNDQDLAELYDLSKPVRVLDHDLDSGPITRPDLFDEGDK